MYKINKYKKIKLVRWLLFTLLIFVSCKNANKEIEKFDPRGIAENELTLTQIADNITYIPIDDSFPIGLIYGNISFSSDAIYLSSQDIGILKYDYNGRYVKKIGSIGRGPGEYVHCSEFRVDEKENVYIRDNRFIKVYSKTGNYLRSFSIEDYKGDIDFFEILDSKIFIFYFLQRTETKNDWIIIDTLGNLIAKKERSLPEFSCEWGEPWLTYRYRKNLYYWNPFTDTIFSINSKLNYNSHYIISPGEHRMPRSKIYSFENYDKYLHVKRLFETDLYHIFIYSYRKPAISLIEKKNGATFLTFLEGNPSGDGLELTGGIKNDFDGGISLLPRSYYEREGREYLVGIINSLQIKTHVDTQVFKNSSPKYPEKKEIFKKLADNIEVTANPILMIVSLKND